VVQHRHSRQRAGNFLGRKRANENETMWDFLQPCAVAMMAASAVPACAQDEPKEKPPMYSYIGFWNIPRAQWADMEKNIAVDQKILDKALADGTIVGCATTWNLVHTADGATHDDGGRDVHGCDAERAGQVLQVRYANLTRISERYQAFRRHFRQPLLHWRPGTYKNAYTRVAMYKLKPTRQNMRLRRSVRAL